MMKYRISLLIAFVAVLLTACQSGYRIEGTSDISTLDGKLLTLRTLRDGQWVTLDSAEVLHGRFKMKGHADSVMFVSLSIGDEVLTPIVLEDGDIKVQLSYASKKVTGTRLNNAFYGFLDRQNSFEERRNTVSNQETQMIVNGRDADAVQRETLEKQEQISKEQESDIRKFIVENSANILGPIVFLEYTKSLYPFPQMSDKIDGLMEQVSEEFKQSALVREYMEDAKENMNLLEEHNRLRQNMEERQRIGGPQQPMPHP